MKKLIICIAFLAAIFVLCLWNINAITDRTTMMIDRLAQGESAGIEGDEEAASDFLEQARALWEAGDLYYCSVLRHSETDEIYTAFRAARGALDAGDTDDFVCHCCELRSHLELVRETEILKLGNIL